MKPLENQEKSVYVASSHVLPASSTSPSTGTLLGSFGGISSAALHIAGCYEQVITPVIGNPSPFVPGAKTARNCFSDGRRAGTIGNPLEHREDTHFQEGSALITIHDLNRPLLIYFRRKRMKKFYQALNITAKTKVLDVGGLPFIWEIGEGIGLPRVDSITCLNIYEVDRANLPSNVHWVIGDGCKLPFADGEFDVVFSNSVIEHLGTIEAQVAFAKEIARVGKNYWVQTPDPRFFMETHYLSPFVHWLPKGILRRIARYTTTWGLVMRPTPQQIDERLAEIRLIKVREFKNMFPGAEIITERFIGMPKALVAKFAHAAG